MADILPGTEVHIDFWKLHVKSLGLGDESALGEDECRLYNVNGSYILKINVGGVLYQLNADAQTLNGLTGPDYQNAANLITGNISRDRLGKLWRDNTSDTTTNPFIQTGIELCQSGSTWYTIPFDLQFSNVPVVIACPNRSQYLIVYSTRNVTPSQFEFIADKDDTYVSYVAIGRKT